MVADGARYATLDWAGWETPFLFFTGKGGVGKTTVASATAVAVTDAGRRVLLVSTDPASNLEDVFQLTVNDELTAVPGAPGLCLLNIDPQAAAEDYRERVVSPYRGLLATDEVRALEEQLSGACTTEIAAFDAFTRLLVDPDWTESFDHILFDTAPTGHTLRLLSLPSAWSDYLQTSARGASCLGPLSGLEAQQGRYASTVRALADRSHTALVLVSRPDLRALREAARAGAELAALGIGNQQLVVNGVFTASPGDDPVAAGIVRLQQQALQELPEGLRALPLSAVPLVADDLRGLAALRRLTAPVVLDRLPCSSLVRPLDIALPVAGDLEDLTRALAAEGPGVILTMGKGGVGKTTIAASIAVALAAQGHSVHLSTTDPAAHLLDALGDELPANLTVSRIDPAVETARYRRVVLRRAGEQDPEARALLEEDLRSPCTEEIAVFQAFSRTLAQARHHFVVLDTAPTGHTLLLLDTTGAYHREIVRKAGELPGRLTTPLMRLQDSAFAHVLIVTLPEGTPVLEAARLQEDLRRAGIEPFGWVVNQLLSTSGTEHPLLLERAAQEARHVQQVADELASRLWTVPWQPEPLQGAARLLALTGATAERSLR